MNDKYDAIKLENQICFPLYACAKEIVRRYKPFLDELDLTYTQYITMMVLWEEKEMNVKELGKRLYLDSGTLTPVLKRLEQKGLVIRKRNSKDERVLMINITKEGEALKEQAVETLIKWRDVSNWTGRMQRNCTGSCISCLGQWRSRF